MENIGQRARIKKLNSESDVLIERALKDMKSREVAQSSIDFCDAAFRGVVHTLNAAQERGDDTQTVSEELAACIANSMLELARRLCPSIEGDAAGEFLNSMLDNIAGRVARDMSIYWPAQGAPARA